MMKIHIKKRMPFLMVVLTLIIVSACSEEAGIPSIDGVWLNMVERPIEQTAYAYPGQTLCVRGHNFDDLRRVIVNGTDINLNTLYVYESDNNITFQLPSDTKIEGDFIRVVTKWGMCEYPFIVRPLSEKPAITSFSSTTLVAGRQLTISGANLNGAKEVWLPLAFDNKAKCELDMTMENDSSAVHVVVPEGVKFATGRCEIIMEKSDTLRGLNYIEKVYSPTTDFK